MPFMFAESMDELMAGILAGLFSTVPAGLLSIASYVLTALALYTIAQRRGIQKPWLAWIPVANSWLYGSLSDQYRYVVRGEKRSKRKVMLVLRILKLILTATVCIQLTAIVAQAIFGFFGGHHSRMVLRSIAGPAVSMLGVSLPLAGVSIAYAVLRYMALYDIFKSLDPNNSVMYLVLSIVFSVTTPFFLFFNRNKDDGMPPRKQPQQQAAPDPARIPEPEPTEPWNRPEQNQDQEYL